MSEPGPDKTTISPHDDLQQMVSRLQHSILHETRRLLRRLLLVLAETALLAIVSLIVLIAGIWRLGDALSLLIASWVGSPGLGELITGGAMITLALGGLYYLRRPLSL